MAERQNAERRRIGQARVRSRNAHLVRIEIAPVLETAMHTQPSDRRSRRTGRAPCLAQPVEGQAEWFRPLLSASQLEIVVVPVAAVVATSHDLYARHARARRANVRLGLREVRFRVAWEAHAEPRLPGGTAARLEVVEVTIALLEPRIPHLQPGDLTTGCAAHLLALAVATALLAVPCHPRDEPNEQPVQAGVLLTIVAKVKPKPFRPRAVRTRPP